MHPGRRHPVADLHAPRDAMRVDGCSTARLAPRARVPKTQFHALLFAVLLSWQALAQTASGEIERLFKALEASGCEFNRNGSWYDGQRASDHLRRKYDVLLEKGPVTSAESFIDLAASNSSMSGKPYLVRCGKSAPVQSRSWFLARLAELRKASARP